jgi:hypothetical protein
MENPTDGWIDFGRGISVQIHEKGAHWRVVDARQESVQGGEVTEVRLVMLPVQITGMIFTTHKEAVDAVTTWLDVSGA